MFINSYNIVTKSWNRHGSGVLIYIRESVNFEELHNVIRTNVEALWIRIKCNSTSFALGIMYRPPSAKNDYLNAMLEQLVFM